MGQTENNRIQLCLGLLAHVDAGKTTLSEAMLYTAGAVRKLGRVDHADAFLDTDAQERERGITIFSKQARFAWESTDFTLLDTPGHVDFSAEAERTLPALDCAVLLISATDGVQGHTRTLWRLLERYHVPTFLFINKTDLPGADKDAVMEELRARLSPDCADLTDPDWMEQAATLSEEALESYLEQGTIPPEQIRALIAERRLFPCLFGSALKLEGVEGLLSALSLYAPRPAWPAETGALVYKISRDPQGARLTWVKVTGGSLAARQTLRGPGWEEKIHQIRLYSGDKYILAETAPAGTVCALTGLNTPRTGESIGAAAKAPAPVTESVFTYRVLTGETDPFIVLPKLRQLEEEDPQLRITWDESLREIRAHLMGRVQLEILQRLAKDRFGLEVDFDEGSILYRETIAAPAEGVGHYEPLRHYAEVHLILSPRERGSGLVFGSSCSTDELDLNWQRLILTHLAEKEHLGVLTGSPVTDMCITLAAGRAHPKHTEGGDFRQATYRAVRQGLMSAESVLLEPWYDLRIELPTSLSGRAMTDIQRMGGSFDPPETLGKETVITGRAPVAELGDYQRELTAYTRGLGHLSCTLRGYEPCREPEKVIAARGYDPLRDVENTPDSVFCAHGAGYTVPWDQVKDHMHLESCLKSVKPTAKEPVHVSRPSNAGAALDRELQAIYERTYGPVKDRAFVPASERRARESYRPKAAPVPKGPEYVLVDGYNIIHAWDELREIGEDNLDAARQVLMDLMSNYQALRGCELILVFDAYRVPYHKEEIIRFHNIYVVYTKEAETADAYIEKTAHEIAKNHRVRVASSDNMEQLIVLSQGALRVSAQAFREEVERAGEELKALLRQINRPQHSRVVAEAMKKAEEAAETKDPAAE
jgi:small GTP-binding protein